MSSIGSFVTYLIVAVLLIWPVKLVAAAPPSAMAEALAAYGQDKASQQQSDKIQAATPEVIGKQIVETIDDVTFSSAAVLKRSNAVTDAQRKTASQEFLTAYQRVTGENLQDPYTALPVVLGLTKILGKRRFHQNGAFQPEEASKYFARLGQLEKDTIRQWRGALGKVAGNSLELREAVFAILTIEPLFDGPAIKTTTSQKMLSRLSSIGPGAISRWREALGTSNIDDTYAALSLLCAEGLFSGDRFQEDIFTKALPIAQQLILERKRNQ